MKVHLQLILIVLPTTSCFGFGYVVKPRQTTLRRQRHKTVDPSPHTHTLHSITSPRPLFTALGMARGGVHGKKSRMIKTTKKKRKNKKPSSPGKHRKTSKRDAQSSDSGQTQKKSSPIGKLLGDTVKSKPSGPPWQVMGQRDAKKNVELEKVRRERIRKGLDKSSDGGNKERIRADVSAANRLMSESDRIMLSWKRFNPQSALSLKFIGGFLDKRAPPSLGVPEVAFLGRSNVGKSSLLNKLVSKAGGDSARVGKTPGATASVNLYALLGQPKRMGKNALPGGEAKPMLGFVDLPGFGYAKLSKDTKESVELAAERYLGKRRELALGVLLVDSRRVPNPDDRAVLAALFDMGVPLIVVATKSDKLKASEIESAMATIRDGLGLPDGQPLRVSGVTGENTKDLWRIILDACEQRVKELKLSIQEGRDDGGVMRMSLEEEDDDADGDDGFYDDELEIEDVNEGTFEDDDDYAYSQGYDWIAADNASDQDGDFYDFDDDDDGYYIDDDNYEPEYTNEEKQRIEKESFKLKSLQPRVDAMIERGEI